jgi:hypothetical protein
MSPAGALLPCIQNWKRILARLFLLAALSGCVNVAPAQQQTSPPFQIYAGYSWLSNSFNGLPGQQKSLNGGNAGVAFPGWHNVRFKLDYSMYRGTNAGALQHGFFVLGGAQYEAKIRRERVFAEALVGEGGLNGDWYTANGAGYRDGYTGALASFAEFLGGGVDAPVSPHMAIRVEGGMQHSGFAPSDKLMGSEPYHPNGVPNYFGRLTVGMVWLPRLGSAPRPVSESSSRTPVESEIIFEGLESVGHFHIFADSWWSYLSAGGIEYDRHSWGKFIGARVDYSAGILPVLILRQPSHTNFWGRPIAPGQETAPGLNISPIGMRMIWRDGKRFKPYYVIKGGMSGYTRKTFAPTGSYEDFSLQQSIGIQSKLNDRWDCRAGFEVFHQSNGFVVPNNAGLDAMMLGAGLSYHLGHLRAGY